MIKRILAMALCVALLPCCALAEWGLSPDDPQVLTLWHYYNGAQQRVFDEKVAEFNETVGSEMGIVIEAVSQGSVGDVTAKLLAAARGDMGAEQMPDICSAYADTAHAVNKMGMIADLSAYMTPEECDEYMDAYIHEGQLDADGTLKVFPIAKSTELMLVNKTVWDQFAAETGVTVEQLATWEGLADVSRRYYEWTDAQTDAPDDGQPFFGRDAFANYILIGSLQLGVEMFEVENGQLTLNIEEPVMRRLWDGFVVPYVSGWYGAYGRFRSDDIKTGQLAALVGSTSGALYFPSEVTRDDGTTYPIECMALPVPNFEGTSPCAVQQGAGMVVSKSTPAREYAATVFLKWFTRTENSMAFSLQSGYLPVKKEGNDPALLASAMDEQQVNGLLRQIIEIGVYTTSTYRLYTNNAFDNGYEARTVVENSMMEAARAAAKERERLTADGMSRADAIALLTGDEAFSAWLAAFRKDMAEALEQK